MKTLLIIDAGLGQARAYMAKTLLGAAAPKAHLELIDNPNDAELVIVLGAALPTDSALNAPWRTRSCSSAKPKVTQRRTRPLPLRQPRRLPADRNVLSRSRPARPALLIPLWRQKPSKPKPKNAAGG